MSQAQQPDPGQARDRPSSARHRRESFWQITLPMLAVALIAILVMAAIVLSGRGGISGAADLSLVLAGLPLLLAGLIVLALVFGLLLGLMWLLGAIPPYTRMAQDATDRASGIIVRAMQRVTDVIISAMAGFAMVQHLLTGRREDGHASQPDNTTSQQGDS